ncbi:assimilatory nitrate reductase catalytic subunit [Murinocardiopsis flavida]|uniref:Assimilatory nitrate reductase catalytic subunit n=1 Tax=Murinocardiopsis flavida TaxID=645275 RepID=A0A2P8DNK5_9ACTN|nr:molybdopterin oxidoreductase family protein [Murinocardiopsis flavida]PSK98804.1 assimilatory nitrate reductase catalytic subunit [Murinocardiopsis flavida]
MTRTHCPYCALQCAMHVESDGAGGHTTRPAPFPTSRGGLCRKGWSAGALLAAPDRLTTPLMRPAKDAPLRPVGWDTALDHVAGRLAALRAERGPDAVAVFGGGGLTNEKSYLLGKFARVALATSQIDYNGRFCMSSAAAAGLRAFGIDRGLPFPVTDLAESDAVLLAGANVAETMPPLMGHLSAPRLIVVDPRRSATAERALAVGGLHLAPRPGTDLALALGILHAVRAEGGLAHGYIEERTTGFDAAWRHCAGWWPERAELTTGVPAADIRAAARILAGAGRAHILTGRGSEQHANGTDTVSAWINLALALGLPGRPGSGYGCLTGQGNGQGGREHGQKADQLPGYRRIDDPAARRHVASVWGIDPGSLPGPGRSASELIDALGTADGPGALLLFGSNPVVSAPGAGRVSPRLAALDLLVVADFVLSETAELADVVLPVTQWAEEDGTMTNLEGRILRRRRAVAPPEGVRSDLEVLHGLAVRLGRSGAEFPADPGTVLAELRAASAGGAADYSGATPERLAAEEALHWPCPDGAGTPRLFLDGFTHPDGRARFTAVDHRDTAEAPDADYPLVATTGRVLAHYQSGAQTRRVPELAAAEPEAFVEVHPDTAAHSGLVDGQWARVVSRRGATEARVRATPGARSDTVFLPFHFAAGQRANLITDTALDPVSRMPEFKACAVRLEPRERAGSGERP